MASAGTQEGAVAQLRICFPQLQPKVIEEALRVTQGNVEAAAFHLLQLIDELQSQSDTKSSAQEEETAPSILILSNGEYASSCGYCDSKDDKKLSWGLHALRLRVEDYQAMIDRGWRRSGTWLYKPNNAKACCVQYTIRLDTGKFKISKSQRHVLKHMDDFLESKESVITPKEKKAKTQQQGKETDKGKEKEKEPRRKNSKADQPKSSEGEQGKEKEEREIVSRLMEEAIAKGLEEGSLDAALFDHLRSLASAPSGRSSSGSAGGEPVLIRGNSHSDLFDVVHNAENVRKQRGDYSVNLPLKLAAAAAKQEAEKVKQEQSPKSNTEATEDKPVSKTQQKKEKKSKGPRSAASNPQHHALALSKLLSTVQEQVGQLPPLRIAPAGGFLNFFFSSAEVAASPKSTARSKGHASEPQLKRKRKEARGGEKGKEKETDQTSQSVSGGIMTKSNESKQRTPMSAQRSADLKEYTYQLNPDGRVLSMRMVPSAFSKEKFALYTAYQTTIHKDKPDEVTEKGFKRFLCDSPLFSPEDGKSESAPPCGYGSFHQEWRVDGKLIAVGVVDILPLCLSSVYFFYDPSYNDLSMGVFSALEEIEWVRAVAAVCPSLKYYYMGFYIHTCKKMRYKGGYHPSDLLCPESFGWAELSECIPLIEKLKYTTFRPVTSEHKVDAAQLLPRLQLLVSKRIVNIQALTRNGRTKLEPILREWIALVGSDLAARIVLSLG